jgi:hypothetical protein
MDLGCLLETLRMTIEQIREAMHQQPFVSFVVRTVGGQANEVRHPDFIATSINGRIITVFDDAGQHILDVGLVSELTYPQTQGS